jgi:WD40 repeat protein
MDKISHHTQPVELITYLERLEKVFSYDSSQKLIIWDINSLAKIQVLIFHQKVQQFFPFKKKASILTMGGETMLLEKVHLRDHFGEFLLLEIVFDYTLKRFLVLTNQEIRYLDYIDGGLQKISIHSRKDLIQEDKFLQAIRTSQGHDYIIGLNENKQFGLYNLNTFEKVREVHSVDPNMKENPSCVFFIEDLDLLAVGYEESKIKGRVTGVSGDTSSPVLT